MNVLYNEIDAYAAQWTRNLAEAGHISAGRVEERSIKDLTPADLAGVDRAHFFSGIGVWDYALRLAGWPEWLDVWTGSCPCQPYSIAGAGAGVADPRHLWPDWFKLIEVCRPSVILGEQVARAAALGWLDLVQTDLEGAGYSFGAAVLPAAGVGAPHKRDRLFFCACSDEFARRQGRPLVGGSDPRSVAESRAGPRGDRSAFDLIDGGRERDESRGKRSDVAPRSEAVDNSDTAGIGRFGGPRRPSLSGTGRSAEPDRHGEAVNGHEPEREGLEGLTRDVNHGRGPGWLDPVSARSAAAAGATRGFWGGCDWYGCRDGKFRPIGPGLFPLAHGAPARVGRLRAYGNAIVSTVAANFVGAVMEAIL